MGRDDDWSEKEYEWVPEAVDNLIDLCERARDQDIQVNLSAKNDTEDVSPYISFMEAFTPAGVLQFLRGIKAGWDDFPEVSKRKMAYLLDGGDPSNLPEGNGPP